MKFGYITALVLSLSWSSAATADDWNLARQDVQRDIRVYTRDVPDSPYQAFYATTRVEASLSTIVAVLSDIQAMPEWIIRLRKSKLLKRDADRDVWLHNIYVFPYPFQDREAVLHSSFRQEKNGVVEINSRAVKGFIPENSRRVRLLTMQSKWRLTPDGKGTVKIELWGQGDPGGYLPPILFNFNLPSGPAYTLKYLRQMLMRDKYQHKVLPYIRDVG